MNCEKCQELFSDFLDDAMSDADRAMFSAHLEECLPCFHVHAELNSIVTFCREQRGQYDAPPNERALWLRIRNTVEGEQATAATQASARASGRESWWSRSAHRSWQLSLPQLAMAVVGIIIFASLATVLTLRGFRSGAGAGLESGGAQVTALTSPNKGSQPHEMKNRQLQQQQLSYLTQMVEQRKAHWNPQVRADFERNLSLLDETVSDSLRKLSQHPHDDVTEEMLDAALNDKMQLLKEFSDL
ncbi:MAG TPA: anti-sigma factor [Pyrinomonadaceae bacterium]